MGKIPARHDRGYRLLFSRPSRVKELLRGFFDEDWVERLDFSTLERVSSSFIAARGLERRDGDLIWKLRFKNGEPVYVYMMIELQSTVDRFMAVRLLTYTSLLYQELLARGELTPSGKLPLVVPLVLYNGDGPWWASLDLADLIEVPCPEAETYRPAFQYRVIDEGTFSPEELDARNSPVAELFRLEKSRSPEQFAWAVRRLSEMLPGAEHGADRRDFVAWLDLARFPGGELRDLPETLSLEEFRHMLADRWDEWKEEFLQEGIQKGRQEGEAELLLRQLGRRFGPLDRRTRDRVHSADCRMLLQWGERVLFAEHLEEIFREDFN